MTGAFNRRGILKIGGAAVAAPYLWLPSRAEEPAWPTQTVAPFIEVEIDSGRIRGGHSRGALAFKGIPYAGSVSGKNRFKAPPPVMPWTGVRDATRLGSPALQAPDGTYGEHEPAYAEDCLVLNVWTPAVKDDGKRPVMFYSHGGGYASGSGGQNIQDGAHLAATYDVVVVAVNHRLAMFGFLYLGDLGGAEYATSGNQSLLDIVAALRWVKRNIATFGGDPDNVMAFGESGGGFKTSMLMGMPSARGLFHKAALQSGPGLRAATKDVATENARRLLAGLGLAPSEIGKLAEAPADKLLAIQLAALNGPIGKPSKEWLSTHTGNEMIPLWRRFEYPGSWGPVVDGTVLPANPFDPAATPLAADVPLLLGNMRDEAVFFMRNTPQFFALSDAALSAYARSEMGGEGDRITALYRKTRPEATPSERGIAILTAMSFGANTATLADRKSRQPAPVYRYRCDSQSNVPVKGTDWTLRACHASDVSLVFLNSEILDLQGNGPGVTDAAKAMSSYFASFARDGVPVASGQPAWPRYDTTSRPVMLLNAQCRVANDPDGEERAYWQSLRTV